MFLRFLKSVALAALAGCVIGMSRPGPGPLIAAIPLLLSILWDLDKRRAGWKGFALGFIAGAISFAIQLNWLSVVSWVGALVLPLYLGLFWGAFGAFASTLGNPLWRHGTSHIRITFANAAVWAFLEWLRSWLFTGFGWNGLGTAFHDSLLFSQAADLLGATGLSLLVVWLGGLFAVSMLQATRITKVGGPIRPSTGWQNITAIAVILASMAGYGSLRIRQEDAKETTPLKALLVQINIPQEAAERLWDPAEIHMAYEEDTLKGLEKAKADGNFPDWVIWPESALTGRIMRTDDGKWGAWEENVTSIHNVREGGDFTLIYGVNELEAVEEKDGTLVRKPEGKAYNSMAVMSPEDDLQTFRKHHLVIFGETIPFVDTIPFLKEIYEQQAGVQYGGSFSPGTSFEPLPAMAGGRTIGIIPSVCFEDTVPRLLRKFVKPGPQVIVNVTNDGWFKQSKASAQHFANARFRAIELRRPMIRCANTGVSAAIRSSGSTDDPKTGKSRILTGPPDGNHFTRNSMVATLEIPIHPTTTLYSVIGDWGIIGLGALGVLFAAYTSRGQYTAPKPVLGPSL